MNIANLFNLTIANIHPNGRVTTVEQFEYINQNGLRMYGTQLTLAIQNGAIEINGFDVKKQINYLKSFV